MWSTLNTTPELQKIKRFQLILLLFLERLEFRRKSEIQLIVRNPYDRLESFFRDKLRKHAGVGKWQHSQRIFFPYLNLQKTSPQEEKKQALLNLSFSDFIALLPKIYQKDHHLHPQYWIEKGIHVDQILKLEQSDDLSFLSQHIGVDFTKKENSTQGNAYDIEWGNASKKIVQEVYQEDYKRYKYKL